MKLAILPWMNFFTRRSTSIKIMYYSTSIAICHSVIIRIGALVLGIAIALSVARIRCQIAGFHSVQSNTTLPHITAHYCRTNCNLCNTYLRAS